jgi:hypothetical protein
MFTRLKRWLPIGLCCLPGLAIAAIIGASVLLGGATFGMRLGGPLGVAILALAFLACPLSMGFMTWRSNRNMPAVANQATATCCAHGDQTTSIPDILYVGSSPEHLAQLVDRREALEHDLALRSQS